MAKTSRQVTGVGFVFLLKKLPNKVLDAEPPIASFLKSMLIGGGPVNAVVIGTQNSHLTWSYQKEQTRPI